MSQKNIKSFMRNRIVIIVLLVILTAVSIAGVVVAKYVGENRREAEILASGFHFSSDILETSGSTCNVTDWGSRGIVFHLYNYEKENVAQISPTAIDYRLTLPEGWQVESVKNNEGVWLTAAKSVYTIDADDRGAGHTVTLKYVGEGTPDASVEVKATSLSPYEKELKATFTLSSLSYPTFSMEDVGYAVKLTINSNNYAGLVRVTWPQGKVLPDNVNSGVDMSAWQNANAVTGETFSAKAYSVYTLYFMKTGEGAVSQAEFSVKGGA